MAAGSPRPPRCGRLPTPRGGVGDTLYGVSRGKVGRSLRRPWAPPTRKGTRAPSAGIPAEGRGRRGWGARGGLRSASHARAPRRSRAAGLQAMASETLNKGAAAAGAKRLRKVAVRLISGRCGCYPVFRRREPFFPPPPR